MYIFSLRHDYWETSEWRPPLNNDHFSNVPQVVVVSRFDCIYIQMRPYKTWDLIRDTNSLTFRLCISKDLQEN